MELFSYYNLSESVNTELVIDHLNKLSEELKIKYSYHFSDDVIRVIDLDLSEFEVEELQNFFEENDVLPDFDCEDRDDESGGLDYGDESDYDF